MLIFLNYFFIVFHTLLIFFNLFGWIFKTTRKWNLATLFITAFSWVVIGFWYGFGYCFCTDWHWQIREQLGYPIPPNSYIQFLLLEYFGWAPSQSVTDTLTLVFFLLAVLGALITNGMDWGKKRNHCKNR